MTDKTPQETLEELTEQLRNTNMDQLVLAKKLAILDKMSKATRPAQELELLIEQVAYTQAANEMILGITTQHKLAIDALGERVEQQNNTIQMLLHLMMQSSFQPEMQQHALSV